MKKAWPVEPLAVSYLLLILAGMILAGYYSPTLGYGLSLTGDYHPAVGAVFVALSLAGIFPPLRKSIISLLTPAPAATGEPVFRSSHIFIFSLLIGLFTFSCPAVNLMMGDGPIFVYEVDAYYSPTEWKFGIKTPFCVIDTALHHLFFLTLGNELYSFLSSSDKAYLVMSMVSALGAFVFIIFLFKVFSVLVKDKTLSKTLAALVLTLGTMAIFSGYIEYIALRVALFMIFILVAVRTLKKGAGPWPLMILSLFCVGFYIAFVALGFSVLYVIYCKRDEIVKRPLSWLLSVVVPSIIFLLLISKMVDLRTFLSLFVSGGDSLTLETGEEVLYGLLSVDHLLDLINVILLHSPLNLLAAAWIVVALLFFRKKWSKDKITVLLLFLLLGFGFELFLFNAKRGIFYDWDIFSYPGLLIPLIAFRLWEVCAPSETRPKIVNAAAILLPLAVMHLLLWGTTLHTRDILFKRLMKCEYSQTGNRFWAGGLSSYFVEENYFPDYALDLAEKNGDFRRLIIYKLCAIANEDKYVDIDFLLKLTDRCADKLDWLDHANIGGALLTKNKDNESIYFLRLSTNAKEDSINMTVAFNLASYYRKQNRPAPMILYFSVLPEEMMGEKSPELYRTIKHWKQHGSLQDSLTLIVPIAAQNVFNNAVSLLGKGHLKSAEQEFIAARGLGFDTLRINRLLERIKKLKNGEL